jgi:hypothetical protein
MQLRFIGGPLHGEIRSVPFEVRAFFALEIEPQASIFDAYSPELSSIRTTTYTRRDGHHSVAPGICVKVSCWAVEGMPDAQLNDLLHPFIPQEIRLAAKLPARPTVVEIPIRESACLSGIAYCPQTLTLHATMRHSGKVYRYHAVPAYRVVDLLTAPSIGKFFNAHIKGAYTGVRYS